MKFSTLRYKYRFHLSTYVLPKTCLLTLDIRLVSCIEVKQAEKLKSYKIKEWWGVMFDE